MTATGGTYMIRKCMGFVLLLALGFVVHPWTALADPTGWSASRISDPAVRWSEGSLSPVVSGDRAWWFADDSYNWKLVTRRFGDPAPTTLDIDTQTSPGDDLRASGDRVVWLGSGGRLLTYKAGDATATLVPTVLAVNGNPDISGDRIAWEGWSPRGPSRVFTWKFGDTTATVLTDGVNSAFDPHVSGDRVVWNADGGGTRHIYTWKAGDSSLTTISVDLTSNSDPQVSGDRAVWVGYGNTLGLRVWTWKAGDAAPTPVTTTAGSYCQPQVWGDRVAWVVGWAGVPGRVYTQMVGDSAPTTVTPSTDCQSELQLSDDRLAWMSQNGSDFQVRTWKVGDSSPMTLSASSSSVWAVGVSNDRIVWGAYEGSGQNAVYAAVNDPCPPETTISPLPSGWVRGPVSFSLCASDTDSPTGISTYYRIDRSAFASYLTTVTISSEGTTTIDYLSVDALGNAEMVNTARSQST